MPSFPVRMVGVIATVAALPYVATQTEFGRNAMSQVNGVFDNAAATQSSSAPGISSDPEERRSGYGNHALHELERLRDADKERFRYDDELATKLGALPKDGSKPTLAGQNVKDLRSILRFDISPDWVIARFARVSTVLADLSLKGLRVPIVTGTRTDDLAGSLTFYFDSANRMQRVTFHGFTGDPTRFVQRMSEYGLQPEASLEAGVYTKRWNGRPVHFMRLSHAPVVYSDAVHQKYTVFLELNQPNLAYGISEEARRIVTSDRHTGRW